LAERPTAARKGDELPSRYGPLLEARLWHNLDLAACSLSCRSGAKRMFSKLGLLAQASS
jgi:hypothetical protein